MGPVVSSALGRLRRYASTWPADIADASQMARLRARIIWAAAILGLVTEVFSLVFSSTTFRSHTWLVPAATVSGLVGIGAYAAARSQRMNDAEFAALIAISQVYAAFSVRWGQGSGQVASTALSLVAPTIMGTLFVERRRWVVVQPVVTLGVLCVVVGTAPPGSSATVDANSGCFALVVVAAVIRLLRDQAIGALRRARHGEVTDPLTGLTNRLGLERWGGRYWSEKARSRSSVAVLVVDADHFKRINDTQGHAAGDEALRRLGEILASAIRADDLAVRLGGEEFLILYGVAPGQAQAVAERIRTTVEEQLAPITVSIGVHEVRPDPDSPVPTSLWSAVDVADQALYVAKKSGRNRVALSHP